MKKFIRNKLKSLLNFIEDNFRIKKSPPDIYFDNLAYDCFKLFEKDMKKASVFLKDDEIRKYSISKALKHSADNNLFLEFGVYKGDSINTFANYLLHKNLNIYGFDSFEGLEEEWITDSYNPVGTFSLNKKPPKVSKNVNLVVGKVQATLENFLEKNTGNKIAFVHMDMDTYTPTKYVLDKIKPFLRKGSIILFDEFYGFQDWQVHEYKAFTELFNEKEYKYIAFGTRQATIEIL
tara:strand:+ start:265 stop:969 length:705 start_codon:yes stop_codon:yes gene_type:complete